MARSVYGMGQARGQGDTVDPDPQEAHMLALVEDVSERYRQLRDAANSMNELRKDVIRVLAEQCGYTDREAAEAFSVPRSTLQRWAAKGDWNVPWRYESMLSRR